MKQNHQVLYSKKKKKEQISLCLGIQRIVATTRYTVKTRNGIQAEKYIAKTKTFKQNMQLSLQEKFVSGCTNTVLFGNCIFKH